MGDAAVGGGCAAGVTCEVVGGIWVEDAALEVGGGNGDGIGDGGGGSEGEAEEEGK